MRKTLTSYYKKGKRNEKAEEKWLFSFYSSFSSAKRYVHLYTHLLIRNICAYMGREKERQNGRKSGYLHTSGAIFLWLFSFPCEKKCAYLSAHQTGSKTPVHTYSHTKWGRRPRNVCIHGGWKKKGRRGEKADVLPAHKEGSKTLR